jgi:hypothetical protein
MDRRDGLSEEALRRALRLEIDERPPRLDPAALVAAAERRTILEQVLRAVRGTVLVGLSLGLEVFVVTMTFNVLTVLDLTGPASVGLSLVAAVAQRVVVLGELTADPSVAVAALAAVLFAIVHERGAGRELIRVRAS